MTYSVSGERAGIVEGVILIDTTSVANVENIIVGALRDGFNVIVKGKQRDHYRRGGCIKEAPCESKLA